ncbi:MAG: hypothetical protein AAF702_09140 [Chloroflexota bacterium]
MTSDLMLPRKWTLKCQGQQVVFVKKSNEKSSHVVMKSLIWALYLYDYPNLSVEIKIGDRYKPDVVALDDLGTPLFWGEAGQVSERKLHSLFKRYPNTHFAIGKWNQRLEPHAAILQKALKGLNRSAPCDLISFPEDSVERFINEQDQIRLSHADLLWKRLH